MIENVSLDLDDFNAEPIIRLLYQGREAQVYLDQKKPILDMGYVFLSS